MSGTTTDLFCQIDFALGRTLLSEQQTDLNRKSFPTLTPAFENEETKSEHGKVQGSLLHTVSTAPSTIQATLCSSTQDEASKRYCVSSTQENTDTTVPAGLRTRKPRKDTPSPQAQKSVHGAVWGR